MKKEILVVTGTRAEYGLLRSTMDELRKNKRFSLSVLVTGMHTLKKYGNTQAEVKKDGYPIGATVPVDEDDEQYQALAKEIKGIGDFLMRAQPDCVLLLGDRDEPFAAAIAAAHLRIPIAHIHGGDRSGFVIDEPIRHSITKFSDLHFTICPSSAARVRQLGEESWRVKVVGAPGFDEILSMKYASRAMVAKELGLDLSRRWILAVQHPTVTDPTPLGEQIRPLLQILEQEYPDDEKIVIYPNSDTGSNVFIAELEKMEGKEHFHLFRNLPRETFLNVFKQAACMVGNSSAGIIESGALHIPALSIGGRQRDRERGPNVLEAGYDKGSVRKGLQRVMSPAFMQMTKRAKSPYGRGGVGKKIVVLLEKLLDDPRLGRKQFIDT